MRVIVNAKMQGFMTAQENEEAVDQPIYHWQSYGTSGAQSYSFFGNSTSQATNGLADTNMDAQNVLSAGKRFAVFGIGVAFLGSAPHVFNSASTASNLKDAAGVLEGIASFDFKIMDKSYYRVAPLSFLPAGFGLSLGGASYQRTQGSAADGNGFIAYAANGVPAPSSMRKLRVPLAIPQQVKFEAVVTFPTAVTISTASRLGVILDGLLIRARQ